INAGAGRELEMLAGLLADSGFAAAKSGRKEMLGELAECIVRSRSGDRLERLLDLIASGSGAKKETQEILLAAVADTLAPVSKGKVAPRRRVRLAHEPSALASLLASREKKIADFARRAETALSWPNKPGDTTPPLTPLSAEQGKRFGTG